MPCHCLLLDDPYTVPLHFPSWTIALSILLSEVASLCLFCLHNPIITIWPLMLPMESWFWQVTPEKVREWEKTLIQRKCSSPCSQHPPWDLNSFRRSDMSTQASLGTCLQVLPQPSANSVRSHYFVFPHSPICVWVLEGKYLTYRQLPYTLYGTWHTVSTQ